MSCCGKETKGKPAEAACCEPKAEEVKAAEKAGKTGCGCDCKESTAKKEEKPSCC